MGTAFVRPISLMVVAVIVSGFAVRGVDGYGGYAYPIAADVVSSFSAVHSGYPATDIFAKCGTNVLAPVSGSVIGLRRSDPWNKKIDNPWFRGGKFVSIIGTDGVRYYLAHLDTVIDGLNVDSVVQVGEQIGTMGRTGRAGACHVHFGISPPCTNPEWWVRRGVIWSAKYLAAWRRGVGKSPVNEVLRWSDGNPQACLYRGQMPVPSH